MRATLVCFVVPVLVLPVVGVGYLVPVVCLVRAGVLEDMCVLVMQSCPFRR